MGRAFFFPSRWSLGTVALDGWMVQIWCLRLWLLPEYDRFCVVCWWETIFHDKQSCCPKSLSNSCLTCQVDLVCKCALCQCRRYDVQTRTLSCSRVCCPNCFQEGSVWIHRYLNTRSVTLISNVWRNKRRKWQTMQRFLILYFERPRNAAVSRGAQWLKQIISVEAQFSEAAK